jgi:hypothetical protein
MTCHIQKRSQPLSYVTIVQQLIDPKNHVFHKKNKNNEIRFHFICELVNNDEISIQFCGSRDQLADIFTKTLGKYNFYFQR